MKSIIVIFTLSACILGTAYAAPYPGSSEIALLNGMTSAEKMQGDYNIGGETTIQDREDAEAQILAAILPEPLLLSEIIRRLHGEVTIQKSEDITGLEILLENIAENIESSSMDKEAKVQLLGTLLKSGLKFLPKAFQILKTGGKKALDFADKLTPGLFAYEIFNAFGGSTQTQASEDGVDMKHSLQLVEDTSSNSMKEEAEAQGTANKVWKMLGRYINKTHPKLIKTIKSGKFGAMFGGKLRKRLGLGEKMIVQTSGEAGNDHRYEKLFELLGGMNKEAKASFFAAGDSPGK